VAQDWPLTTIPAAGVILFTMLQGRLGDMEGMKIRRPKFSTAHTSFSAFVTGGGTAHWNGPEFHRQWSSQQERLAAVSTKSADVHNLGAMLWAMVLGANLLGEEGLEKYWPVGDSAFPLHCVSFTSPATCHLCMLVNRCRLCTVCALNVLDK
jgi:hypothetical protein